MEVVFAQHMGFCMGVRKAVQAVEDLIVNEKGRKISTYGPLIHNRLVLEKLALQGVNVIESPNDAEGIVVIRAHGIGPDEKKILEERADKVVDATCPRVLNSQKKAREASLCGMEVIICGDRDHGEVQGIAGYAEKSRIIGTTGEAENLEITLPALVISQTTFSRELYAEICAILEKKFPGIGIASSICPATEKRQEALTELAGKVDAVIVIGGKNSANTIRLYQSALKLGKKAWLIENADELPDEIRKFGFVGITAGASTPDWIIKEVADKLKSY